MSFLQKSALHKHLSTTRHLPRHNEDAPAEGLRVILRDGNLVTVPASATNDQPADDHATNPA
jgi:beta-galactosidase GanA